ncbi:MAG: outer membrane beta-barrel protein [Vicinamibacterales bacterium]
MIRKALLGVMMLAVLSSTAWAQSPKVEFTGLIGWSLSDGVSGDPVIALDGNVYDRVDPKDSMNFGFSLGFFLTPSAELGFLWRRQATELEIAGTSVRTLGDINIDGYHGYGAYYFGDSEAKVRPYIMGGLGVTNYGSVSYDRLDGTSATTESNSQFSTTWGAGLKVNASRNVGMKIGLQWTPTYIKSDAAGWWCDPWWGCYVIGDAQYANQFELVGGISFRF